MSLRSATRLARPAIARAIPKAQAVPRRFASGQSSGSDMPWMVGSLAVFGSLGAFILMPRSGAHPAETVHESIDAKSAGKNAGVATSHNNPALEEAHDEEQAVGEANSETPVASDETSSTNKSVDADPSAKGTPSKKDDEKKATGGEEKDESSEEGEPSKQDVKDSIVQAVKSNAPEVAWNEEEKK